MSRVHQVSKTTPKDQRVYFKNIRKQLKPRHSKTKEKNKYKFEM